jgi:DNA-binding transcriptional regulator YbjK
MDYLIKEYKMKSARERREESKNARKTITDNWIERAKELYPDVIEEIDARINQATQEGETKINVILPNRDQAQCLKAYLRNYGFGANTSSIDNDLIPIQYYLQIEWEMA